MRKARHGLKALAALLACCFLLASEAKAASGVTIAIKGSASIVYDSARDGCDQDDVPDVDPHAIRDASGQIVMFALQFANHPLRGPDLAHLKIDCHIALNSALDPDPAHYADRSFISSLWTDDGKTVTALVHHEYHADHFGRCRVEDDLACWYNTILSYRSSDGGLNFTRSANPVVAAAPFRQDFEQGRHRGFFLPSNIVSDGVYKYFFSSTTGWSEQPYGACLFRSATPAKAETWRAFDGHGFTIKYADPYAAKTISVDACKPIAPFVFPVGSVVRQRGTGVWIAIFQASRNEADYPVDGFYFASARDLLHWSAPKLLVAGQTIMSDLCKGGDTIIGYPSIIDEDSTTRTFQDVGRTAYLYYTRAKVEKCGTGQRLLLRQQIEIDTLP